MRVKGLAVVFALLCAVAARGAEIESVDIDGVVHPVTVEVISHALDEAAERNAAIVLIRLNTPGGLADATRELTGKIVASPVPVVTYVAPSGGRAASAGFFLLEAGDVAAMAPGTNTGAATPVLLMGGEMDPTMRKKVQNDAAAWIRSLVSKRGRNTQLAESTVLEAKSFTDTEALQSGLIDLVATNDADLFRKLDGREITRFDGRKQVLRLSSPHVVEYHRTLREKIVGAVADPNLALILLVVGALGIYIEFLSPGLIIPGALGAILVLLALSALAVLPINWGAAALLVLAFVLFILEAKFTSHGLLTIGGTAAMVFGALLLVRSPLPQMQIHLGTALALALPFALVTSFLLSLAIRAKMHKVTTGTAGMLGEIGVAHTPLAPQGKIFVHGEYWDAVSSAPVEAGARVKVLKIEGLTLMVEPASSNSGGKHD